MIRTAAVVTLAALAVAGCGGSGTKATGAGPKPAATAETCPAGQVWARNEAKCVPWGATPTEVLDEPTEPATPAVFPLGYTATISQDDVDVATIQVSKLVIRKRTTSEFGDNPKNGLYVTVTVAAKAIGSQSFDLNPFDFYMRSAAGDHFEYGDGNAWSEGGDDALDAVTLNAGERIRGTVTFDVPKTATQLVYAPFTEAICVWKLK